MQKLPTHDSVQDLSEQFGDNFIQEIVTIRNELRQSINIDNQCDETDVIFIQGSIKPTTTEEISKIISSSASKSCDLNPIPTFEGFWSSVCLNCYQSSHKVLFVWTATHQSSHISLNCLSPPVLYFINWSWLLPLHCWKKCCWTPRS